MSYLNRNYTASDVSPRALVVALVNIFRTADTLDIGHDWHSQSQYFKVLSDMYENDSIIIEFQMKNVGDSLALLANTILGDFGEDFPQYVAIAPTCPSEFTEAYFQVEFDHDSYRGPDKEWVKVRVVREIHLILRSEDGKEAYVGGMGFSSEYGTGARLEYMVTKNWLGEKERESVPLLLASIDRVYQYQKFLTEQEELELAGRYDL